jgi:serine phosphatase RsbU (regulator of sigma subunit)
VLNFETEIHSESPDNFVLFHPKEIVSGDFYWYKEVSLVSKKLKIIAVVDCTGHGVPGAFMSILGAMFLNKIVAELNSETKACDVLNKMRNELINLLSQHSAPSSLKDGMDMALCIIDYADMKIQYAGACNPIYVIRKGQGVLTTEVEEYKGDNMPIGVFINKQASFTNHDIDVTKGDVIYLFTDGYYNQFGGESGKKLNRKLFKEILLKNAHLPMNKQKLELNQFLRNWRGGFEQIDDITIVGIRV